MTDLRAPLASPDRTQLVAAGIRYYRLCPCVNPKVLGERFAVLVMVEDGDPNTARAMLDPWPACGTCGKRWNRAPDYDGECDI